MKIVLIGESPKIASGFGQQMGMLARQLVKCGHSPIVLANNGEDEDGEYPVYHNRRLNDPVSLDRQIEKFHPDAMICFYHTRMAEPLANLEYTPQNCPVYWWLPWEGTTAPQWLIDAFRNYPKNRIVHLSKFAQRLWKPHIDSDVIIPHAVNDAFFEAGGRVFNRDELRKKWSHKLRYPLDDKGLILLNVDRNTWHKRWDLTFDLVRRLKIELPNNHVQLIAHTLAVAKEFGNDLIKLSKLYGVYENIAFSGFDWLDSFSHADLAELYQVADVRISTSAGEGFGIPTAECAACKVPQVIPRHTSLTEVLDGGSAFLVEPNGQEVRDDVLWQIPDVPRMMNRILRIVRKEIDIDAEINIAYTGVSTRFNEAEVGAKWDSLLTNDRPIDCWVEGRWGYHGQLKMKQAQSDLAYLLLRMNENAKIFEIGSFNGHFVHECAKLSLDVVGYECNVHAFEQWSSLANHYIIQTTTLLDSWPEDRDVLIVPDIFDLVLQKYGLEGYTEFLARIGKFTWAFLDRREGHVWGKRKANLIEAAKRLEDYEMTRREDLESLLRQHFPNRIHRYEVWQRGKDTSIIPQGWLTMEK